jgi:hypothetical protein
LGSGNYPQEQEHRIQSDEVVVSLQLLLGALLIRLS